MKRKFLGIIVLYLMIPFSSIAADDNTSSQKDYHNSIKITFLSWFSGSTKVSYERAFPKLRQSGEICTSLISAGYDKYNNKPLGFTLRYGHKFFIGENDISLKGFYLRPEIVYSRYHYDGSHGGRTLAEMGALLGTFGYQYVYKRFLADFWVGDGYAIGTPAETRYHHGFELWHWFNRKVDNLAMSFSIRIGICF